VKEYLEYLESFAVIVLVLFGIGGFSYHLFRNDGWVETLAGNLWDVSVQYPLIALPVIVGAVFIFRTWNAARIAHGRATSLPDLVIYALMASGAVFIGRYFYLGYF
jgi:di/tricarboxylate transporter